MEGQAVSDWEKPLVTCMDWWKFWFRRSSCKDEPGTGKESGRARSFSSFSGCTWGCPGALLESGELPAPVIELQHRAGFQCLQLPERLSPTCLAPRYSKPDPWPSLRGGGMAGAYLYALTARRPKNRHISDMHANVHSEQTHLVAREELPAWSSTVPLNWCIHIKERHLNNAKG